MKVVQYPQLWSYDGKPQVEYENWYMRLKIKHRVAKDDVEPLVRELLRCVNFNLQWYLTHYDGV